MLIEVFKTGIHTDSKGRRHTYTAEMLDQLVRNYAAQVEENPNNLAPLVKGHPEANEPALGWVKKLCRRGKKLVAQVDNIAPELIDDIKNDKFKHFSIALYPDMNLRHIGILGAVPPAVKDLNPNGIMDFSTKKDYSEFAQESQIELLAKTLNDKQNMAELKNYLNQTSQVEKQDTSALAGDFSEESAEPDSRCHAAEIIGKLQAANDELLKHIYELEQQNRRYEFNAYVNTLAENSPLAWTPAQKLAFIEILETAASCSCGHSTGSSTSEESDNDAQEAEYSSNCRRDNATDGHELTAKIKAFVEGMEFVAPTGELLTELNWDAGTMSKSTSTGGTFAADPARHQIHKDALNYCQKHPEATYSEAVAAVVLAVDRAN